MFNVTYPSAEINHWNRLMTSTLEYRKVKGKTEAVLDEAKKKVYYTYIATYIITYLLTYSLHAAKFFLRS